MSSSEPAASVSSESGTCTSSGVGTLRTSELEAVLKLKHKDHAFSSCFETQVANSGSVELCHYRGGGGRSVVVVVVVFVKIGSSTGGEDSLGGERSMMGVDSGGTDDEACWMGTMTMDSTLTSTFAFPGLSSVDLSLRNWSPKVKLSLRFFINERVLVELGGFSMRTCSSVICFKFSLHEGKL
ncbi:hypothetical protein Tco_0051807 [Tanacetum coccineum]